MDGATAKLSPEQRCRKVEYLLMAYLAQRAAVASAHKHSSLDVMSQKEQARVVEVRAMLERGENPFSHITESGASDNDGSVRERVRVIRELTDADILKLETYWKSGAGSKDPVHKAGFSLFSEDEVAQFKQEKEYKRLHPEALFCSFCGSEVDRINATLGQSKTRMITIERLELIQDVPTIIREIKTTTDKLVACPDCVLNIKPVLDKDGNIINQGIKFPEMRG